MTNKKCTIREKELRNKISTNIKPFISINQFEDMWYLSDDTNTSPGYTNFSIRGYSLEVIIQKLKNMDCIKFITEDEEDFRTSYEKLLLLNKELEKKIDIYVEVVGDLTEKIRMLKFELGR